MVDDIGKHVEKLLKSIRSGFYALIILELLNKHGPLYGYKIKVLIEEMSNGVLKPSESTIYETLKQLMKNKLIKSFWGTSEYGPPKKYYELTEEGLLALKTLRSEVKKLIEVIKSIQKEDMG